MERGVLRRLRRSKGKIIFANGEVQEGIFRNGVLKEGRILFPDGEVRIGEFTDGFLEGKGKNPLRQR